MQSSWPTSQNNRKRKAFANAEKFLEEYGFKILPCHQLSMTKRNTMVEDFEYLLIDEVNMIVHKGSRRIFNDEMIGFTLFGQRNLKKKISETFPYKKMGLDRASSIRIGI